MQKYSKIIQLRLFAPDYIVNDLQLLKEIILSHEIVNHQDPGTIIFHSNRIPTNKSLFSIRNDEWRSRRKAMAPSFNSTKILGFVEIFEKKSSVLIDILSKVADKEVVFDFRQTLSKLTADILGETVFGVDFDSLRDPANKLSNAVDSFLTFGNLLPCFLLPFWYKFPLASVRSFLSGTNTLVNLCRQIATDRKGTNTTNNDLMQTLVDSGLDLNEAIIPESLLFLVAGHETTANLLSWTVALLSQNPHVEQKLVEEIDRVIGSDKITADKVDSLEYLECIINETLRLYPPALQTDRNTDVPVKLAGVQFPKNSQFFIPIWAIHHNDKYWPDPEKFDPTRFDSNHKDKMIPFSFLPFGGGSRICIGWKFALTEAKVVLATIYQTYHVTLKEEAVPASNGGLLRPESVMVTVKKRKME